MLFQSEIGLTHTFGYHALAHQFELHFPTVFEGIILHINETSPQQFLNQLFI